MSDAAMFPYEPPRLQLTARTLEGSVCALALALHEHCEAQARSDPAFDAAEYLDLVLTELKVRICDHRLRAIGQAGRG